MKVLLDVDTGVDDSIALLYALFNPEIEIVGISAVCGYVETYDQQFQGRNRKYYKITQSGKIRQEHLKKEWKEYITIIDDIVNGGMGND